MFRTKSNFKKEFTQRMLERYGVSVGESHISEKYQILGEMVRDYANVDWSDTHTKTIKEGRKTLVYFSMEFLIGRLLVNNMQNMGIYEVARYKKAKKVAHLESLNEESDSAFQDGPQKSVEEFVLDGNKTNTQTLKQEIEGKSSTTIKEIKRDRVKDGNGME